MSDANGSTESTKNGERSDIVSLPHGDAVVFCTRSPYKETPNEDAAVLIEVDEHHTVLAVADGMGGQPSGAQASSLALDTLIKCVQNVEGKEESIRASILNSFEHANERILSLGTGAGTTLAVVSVNSESIRSYHAGDSMILVVGQRGKMKFQSLPHSPIGYAVESGMLAESDAIHHEDRHIVSNYVGSMEMRIDIGPAVPLRQRDTVVIGSDGLFDNLHLDEIVQAVRKGPLPDAAFMLSETGRQRMMNPEPGAPSKADDLTFILFRPHAERTSGTSTS